MTGFPLLTELEDPEPDPYDQGLIALLNYWLAEERAAHRPGSGAVLSTGGAIPSDAPGGER
jgi:hypothetical protein